jgi:hypothetical protein
MSSDMNLIMEGWRGYLLEEQAMQELHQELLTEDFADLLQKLKDAPATIKNSLKGIKKDMLADISAAWGNAGLKAQNASGSIKDFVDKHIPAKYRRLAIPALVAILTAAVATGRAPHAQHALRAFAAGGNPSIALVASFLVADMPEMMQSFGLAENVQRL